MVQQSADYSQENVRNSVEVSNGTMKEPELDKYYEAMEDKYIGTKDDYQIEKNDTEDLLVQKLCEQNPQGSQNYED